MVGIFRVLKITEKNAQNYKDFFEKFDILTPNKILQEKIIFFSGYPIYFIERRAIT